MTGRAENPRRKKNEESRIGAKVKGKTKKERGNRERRRSFGNVHAEKKRHTCLYLACSEWTFRGKRVRTAGTRNCSTGAWVESGFVESRESSLSPYCLRALFRPMEIVRRSDDEKERPVWKCRRSINCPIEFNQLAMLAAGDHFYAQPVFVRRARSRWKVCAWNRVRPVAHFLRRAVLVTKCDAKTRRSGKMKKRKRNDTVNSLNSSPALLSGIRSKRPGEFLLLSAFYCLSIDFLFE